MASMRRIFSLDVRMGLRMQLELVESICGCFRQVENVKQDEIVSVNGVGDTFAGALVAGMAKTGSGARVEDFVDVAQRAAVLTLKSKESVSPGLGTLRLLL